MNIRDALQRVVFSLDGDEWTLGDVVEVARARGDWERLERHVEQRAGSRASRTRREVEAIADAFRYERNLLAVDDTRRWFESWGISLEEWLSHLAFADSAPDGRDAERVLWVEAVTSGVLDDAARWLVDSLAAHCAVGEGSRRPAIADLERSLERFAAAASSPERLAAVVADRHLAWTSFSLQEVAVSDEGVAHEVVHSLHDGRPLHEVARDAGTRVIDRRLLLEEAPRELQSRLCGSSVGELIGPLRLGDLWLVVSVMERVEPSTDDPEIARIARDRAVRQALLREVSRRVHWLDPVMTAPR